MSYLLPSGPRGSRGDRALDWLLRVWPFIIALATLACIAMAMVDCSDKRACRDRGGMIEEYNKHTIMVPVSCGSGCTVIVPQEISDWRCSVDSDGHPVSAPATGR